MRLRAALACAALAGFVDLTTAIPPVEVGLERVAAEPALLRGKRVGLLAHAASVTVDGRHAVDVLRSAGVEVVRLFAAEHGLRGEAAAGERIADSADSRTGLPVVSLYGARARPSPADFAGLDALVVDLQDAGVRFYTYASTMLLAMEAAAGAGIAFVVLDRPNPLGGERIEGPASDPRDVVPESLVNRTPGPLVHGLTLGEMARFMAARAPRPVRLQVVPMRGWQRSMTWVDTGRPWVAPSPNLRSADAALAYPGTALLEATNLSEGRGTDAPFLLLGAPWLPPSVLVDRVSAPGFTLEPAWFTPRAEPAAPAPRFRDQRVAGIRVRVVDRAAAQPYRLGVALLYAARSHPGFAWRAPDALDALVGTRRLRESLEQGQSVDAIVASNVGAHTRFRRDRQVTLLYRN